MWSAPQQSAPRPGQGHARPGGVMTFTVATWVGRSQASITHPVNSHTSFPARSELGPAEREGRQAQPSRYQPEALQHGQPARTGEHQPMMAEGPEADALPEGRHEVAAGEGAAGALHQPTERHAARDTRARIPGTARTSP